MRCLLLLALVAACGSTTNTTVDSVRHPGAAPFETVMVFTNISDPPFAGAMNLGFENQLRAGLAACGVRSEFRAVVEDGGAFMERSEASMQAMHTNAALIVKEWGGNVTTYESRQGPSGSRFNVSVKLQLFDRRTQAFTWEATVNYRGYKGQATEKDGEAFASAILAQMRSDAMITCAANG